MKAHILVVEDSQVERLRLVKLLDAAGFSVSTAENGLEAIELVQHQQHQGQADEEGEHDLRRARRGGGL